MATRSGAFSMHSAPQRPRLTACTPRTTTASTVRHEIAELTARRTEAERRADYLRHVADEIEQAQL